MKKLGFLFIIASLLLPLKSEAADRQIGFYVAPKFIYGQADYGSMKEDHNNIGESDYYTFPYQSGKKTDSTFGMAFAIGYDFSKKYDFSVRTELEYAIFDSFGRSQEQWDDPNDPSVAYGGLNHVTKPKISIQSLMINAYYDFKNSTNFTPWINLGAGLAFVGMKSKFDVFPEGENSLGYDPDIPRYTNVSKKTKTNFAWSIGAGCAYEITTSLSLDFGYRFAQYGKGETKYNSIGDPTDFVRSKTETIKMHQFIGGIRYTF